METIGTKSPERFQELDVLRGCAALAVVVFHYTAHVARYYADFPIDFPAGKYGVHLFFCISGFVIYWTLERSRTLADFAVSRFSRLYPAYWTAILLWVACDVFILGAKPWPGGYLANITMLQAFFGIPDLDGVYWTLAVELTWYAWMGLIFAAGALDRMVWIGAAWLVASIAQVFLSHFANMPAQLARFAILPHVPWFIAGTMFYLMRRDGMQRQYIAVMLLAAIAAVANETGEFALVAVIFALFLLAIRGVLSFLVHPVTMWLGSVSYALYLTHQNLGLAALKALHARGVPSAWSVPGTMLGALALASAITYLVERPAMRLLRRYWRRG